LAAGIHGWSRAQLDDILNMRSLATPRRLLQKYALDITCVDVNIPTILQALDTPVDYAQAP
jgi:hypothetical protein